MKASEKRGWIIFLIMSTWQRRDIDRTRGCDRRNNLSPGGTAAILLSALDAFERADQKRVFEAFGVALTPEPVSLGSMSKENRPDRLWLVAISPGRD
jgi:hypothetical protein